MLTGGLGLNVEGFLVAVSDGEPYVMGFFEGFVLGLVDV
jgi:hypothetical protein